MKKIRLNQVKHCELIKSVTCDKNESVTQAAKKMRLFSQKYVIITEKSSPIGIVSSTDVAERIVAEEKNPKKTKVYSIMSSPIFVLKHEEDLEIAIAAMIKKNIAFCPVINDKEEHMGMIHLSDLIKKAHE